MPIHIDRIDSEIEIVPARSEAPRAEPSAQARSPDAHRNLVRELDTELREYLRTRG